MMVMADGVPNGRQWIFIDQFNTVTVQHFKIVCFRVPNTEILLLKTHVRTSIHNFLVLITFWQANFLWNRSKPPINFIPIRHLAWVLFVGSEHLLCSSKNFQHSSGNTLKSSRKCAKSPYWHTCSHFPLIDQKRVHIFFELFLQEWFQFTPNRTLIEWISYCIALNFQMQFIMWCHHPRFGPSPKQLPIQLNRWECFFFFSRGVFNWKRNTRGSLFYCLFKCVWERNWWRRN